MKSQKKASMWVKLYNTAITIRCCEVTTEQDRIKVHNNNAIVRRGKQSLDVLRFCVTEEEGKVID